MRSSAPGASWAAAARLTEAGLYRLPRGRSGPGCPDRASGHARSWNCSSTLASRAGDPRSSCAGRAGEPDELRPLTPSGHEAARLLGLLLADRSPDAVVSSPLLRARETARGSCLGRRPRAAGGRGPRSGRDGLDPARRGRRPGRHGDRSRPPARLRRDRALALTGREVSFPTAGFAELEL